ncbi:dienelactone hydrolase family protein [Limibaculum sp. M0105]|uniref:Dienelactone hydrolase family protein n=1 Tax=Thermohalobaculum xanthum TaxID=2753746 RepID=A0A8J7MAQ9_9RHOB|nr:dienelactone hydrolase family protein [Thermohalobaculum xanthum]MBK0400747.1 dienelactone hydrolase family protein [Thermohalobaculum xanthum]
MRRLIPLVLLTALLTNHLLAGADESAAPPCGNPEGICSVENGIYRLRLPDSVGAAPVPAVIYLHGWGGNSLAVMRGANRVSDATVARGYALIVPEGVPKPGREQRDWAVRDMLSNHPRDDIAFLASVLDDAAARGIDRSRVLLAGFSRGGSMVWDVACRAPGLAHAYAPVAGAFWEPLPDDCNGPVNLFHTHGWTDRVVPLEGRSVADGRLIQGDAFASLAIMRDMTGCDARMPDTTPMEADGGIWWRHWTSCPGGRLDLMLHPGGHALPDGWIDQALTWFELLE